MNEGGIYPVFLKGTAFLLEGIYRDPGEPRFSRWFCAWYDFSLSFPRLYRPWVGIRKAVHLVLVRYAGKLLRAIFSRQQRKAILRRLQDPEWYGNHLISLGK